VARVFRVTGIRTEPSANQTHDHVAAIRQGTNPQLIRREVIAADLRDPSGDRYHVEVGDRRADLVAVPCPICNVADYLRTTADSTTADLLLSLPRV
jgi:hypothetical protein